MAYIAWLEPLIYVIDVLQGIILWSTLQKIASVADEPKQESSEKVDDQHHPGQELQEEEQQVKQR